MVQIQVKPWYIYLYLIYLYHIKVCQYVSFTKWHTLHFPHYLGFMSQFWLSHPGHFCKIWLEIWRRASRAFCSWGLVTISRIPTSTLAQRYSSVCVSINSKVVIPLTRGANDCVILALSRIFWDPDGIFCPVLPGASDGSWKYGNSSGTPWGSYYIILLIDYTYS